MRLSAKGRYAMAAMIYMASHAEDAEPITVLRISLELDISKIYLEQVFALLKRGGFVKSVKGAQGGYYLARHPEHITAYDVLQTVESGLFEGTQERLLYAVPQIDRVIRDEVLNQTDEAIRSTLSRVTIKELARKAAADPTHMYYI